MIFGLPARLTGGGPFGLTAFFIPFVADAGCSANAEEASAGEPARLEG